MGAKKGEVLINRFIDDDGNLTKSGNAKSFEFVTDDRSWDEIFRFLEEAQNTFKGKPFALRSIYVRFENEEES